MYGRKITPTLRTGTPVHLYLPGPHRGVFNVAGLEDSKTIILCEALIDALTFWCAGFTNVTASYGVEGFTADHLDAFKRHGTERVLIAYDRDEAGDAAADRLAPKLMAEGIECWRIQFPHRMDANEYARKVTPAEKGLGVLVRNAVWLGKGTRPIMDLGATSKESGESLASDEKVLDRDFVTELAAPEPAPVAALPLAAKEEIETPPAMGETPPPTTPDANTDEVTLDFGDRRYRVRGLAKNLSHEALRVNVLVSRGDLVHVDTLDLYSSRQRAAFIKQAASELKAQEQTIKEDASHLLRRLEEIQEERIKRALEPKVKEVKLSDEETREALALLKDPRLLDRVLADFAACGTVGEETNKLIGYLAAVSRKLDEPLAVIIQSSSAAGKTSLMEAILSMMPVEERVKYSAMTGQSLFYMGETDLKHKILAIVEEQGAERASYALKLLQSEGELMIASTGKDPATGRLVTHEYRVEGPVMIFLTTTAIEIDEELLNRCLVLTVDEDRDQTRAIHRLQRERQTLEGLLARRSRPGILKVHQDAQRLLKPLLVANPYAPSLTFLDDRTRTRRDHVKYLTLIRTITLLHQYQRPICSVEHRGAVVPYIEVTLEDIAIANRLAHQVLGRSLDELAPQTRRLLMSLELMVGEACAAQKIERAEYRFTRRDVRAATGWNQTQLRMHLDRLVDLEYVIAHHGKQGQGYVYELLYDGQGKDGVPFLPGLIDAQALGTTETSRGQTLYFAGSSRAESGPLSGPSRGDGGFILPAPVATESTLAAKEGESAHRGPRAEAPSRRTFSRRTAAVR